MVNHLRAAQLVGLLGIIGILGIASAGLASLTGPVVGARAQGTGDSSTTLHMPLALLGSLPDRTPSTPEPTSLPTETPTPTATGTPTSTPTSLPASRPLVQVASYGGLLPDTQFGVDEVLRSPWYNLYEDGVVVTYEHSGGRPLRHKPLVASLDAQAVNTHLARLLGDANFFEIAPPDESGLCVTDLHTTYVYVSDGESRSRTLAVYGLDWFLRGEAPCRPRSGTPEPPSDSILELAEAVADLRSPPADSHAYWPDAGTLIVTRDRPSATAPEWPLAHQLAAISTRFLQVGQEPLSARDTSAVLAVLGEGISGGWSMAAFSQDGETYRIGLRIEPPDWDGYLSAVEPTPTPTSTATSASAGPQCPPVRPKCTPGPAPTPCVGPGCPTPDPCPCEP